MRLYLLPMVIAGFLTGISNGFTQTVSLDDPVVKAAYEMTVTPSGVPYRDKVMHASSKQWFDDDLATAQVIFDGAPYEESSYSWLGRRHGYMGNYAKAIEIFTNGMRLFPNSYRLYRYRGFFLIRNYQFEQGIADFRKAEELIANEDVTPVQEGIPGRSNFSPSAFKRNIYYYLAEASMATGDYNTVLEYMDKAVEANELKDEDDILVSTAFYKYMALRKLGRHDDAAALIKDIPTSLTIIDNFNYHEAIKFLQGRYTKERFMSRADTIGKYAIAMVDRFNDKNTDAAQLLSDITKAEPKGFWLAEAELTNIK